MDLCSEWTAAIKSYIMQQVALFHVTRVYRNQFKWKGINELKDNGEE